MITAKEANKKTREAVSKLQEQAAIWVENEWEFIEAKIQEAAEQGNFSTSYWWSNELLEKAGVEKQYAAQALESKADELGFRKVVWTEYSNNNVLRIEIDWIRGVDK